MRHIACALATLLFICVSCNDKPTVPLQSNTDTKAKKNLEAWHRVTMAFVTGNPEAINPVMAEDYIDHTNRGDVKGRDSVKAKIMRSHANLEDVKMQSIKEFADDDYGVFWMRFSGNSKGQMGIPRGPFDITSVQVVRFKDGKAVEHWEYMDMKQMMEMMHHRK